MTGVQVRFEEETHDYREPRFYDGEEALQFVHAWFFRKRWIVGTYPCARFKELLLKKRRPRQNGFWVYAKTPYRSGSYSLVLSLLSFSRMNASISGALARMRSHCSL